MNREDSVFRDRSRSRPEDRRPIVFDFGRPDFLPFDQRPFDFAAARHLSAAQERVRPELRPDRCAHAGVSGHRIAAAAGDRIIYGSTAAALCAAVRHGGHCARPRGARLRAELCGTALGLRVPWRRLVNLSSGILAHGASGFRWCARLRAVAVSGRRQFRQLAGAAAGRPRWCCLTASAAWHGSRCWR